MEEGVAHMADPVGWALIHPKEVIHTHVQICQEFGVGAEEEGVPGQRNRGRI